MQVPVPRDVADDSAGPAQIILFGSGIGHVSPPVPGHSVGNQLQPVKGHKVHMRILLMGGTGEVGHHIANGLVKRGHQVDVLMRGLDRRGFPLDSSVQRILGDKNEVGTLEEAAARLSPEVVIDTVPCETSVRNVEAVFSGRIRQYIHCSSTGVYGHLQYLPADEDHPWVPDPHDFYVPVADRDRLAMDLHRQGCFPVTIFRPTMIIGPGSLPVDNLGGRSRQFLQDLLANIPIDLPEDGDVLIQGGFNADLAEAFVLAVEHADRSMGEIFNISCRKAVTLRHYLESIKEAIGSTSALVPMPVDTILERHRDDGRIDEYWFRFLCRHMCFDIGKAAERLGYIPKYELRESISRVVEWLKMTSRL